VQRRYQVILLSSSYPPPILGGLSAWLAARLCQKATSGENICLSPPHRSPLIPHQIFFWRHVPSVVLTCQLSFLSSFLQYNTNIQYHCPHFILFINPALLTFSIPLLCFLTLHPPPFSNWNHIICGAEKAPQVRFF
jgi:hypothetical protein